MPESLQMNSEHLTILTVKEVAEYLHLSEAKVYRLASGGGLPAVRIGKTWRFPKDQLCDWLSRSAGSNLKARQ